MLLCFGQREAAPDGLVVRVSVHVVPDDLVAFHCLSLFPRLSGRDPKIPARLSAERLGDRKPLTFHAVNDGLDVTGFG